MEMGLSKLSLNCKKQRPLRFETYFRFSSRNAAKLDQNIHTYRIPLDIIWPTILIPKASGPETSTVASLPSYQPPAPQQRNRPRSRDN